MPILLVLLLSAACLQVEWPNPLGLAPRESAWSTLGVVFAPLAAAFVLRTWVVRALSREPSRRNDIGTIYDRIRRTFLFLNLGLVALAIAGLGWGHAVWARFTIEWREESLLVPFGELAVILPYFAILFGSWLIYYDAEAALFRSGRGGVAFWTRTGYFFHHLRQFALLIFLPLGLMLVHRSASRFLPEMFGKIVPGQESPVELDKPPTGRTPPAAPPRDRGFRKHGVR